MGVRMPKRQACDLLSHSDDRALDLDCEAVKPRTALIPLDAPLCPTPGPSCSSLASVLRAAPTHFLYSPPKFLNPPHFCHLA